MQDGDVITQITQQVLESYHKILAMRKQKKPCMGWSRVIKRDAEGLVILRSHFLTPNSDLSFKVMPVLVEFKATQRIYFYIPLYLFSWKASLYLPDSLQRHANVEDRYLSIPTTSTVSFSSTSLWHAKKNNSVFWMHPVPLPTKYIVPSNLGLKRLFSLLQPLLNEIHWNSGKTTPFFKLNVHDPKGEEVS